MIIYGVCDNTRRAILKEAGDIYNIQASMELKSQSGLFLLSVSVGRAVKDCKGDTPSVLLSSLDTFPLRPCCCQKKNTAGFGRAVPIFAGKKEKGGNSCLCAQAFGGYLCHD